MTVDTAAPLAPLNVRPLTAHDRCDRCGAQAYIAAEFGTSELLFCGHHGRKHSVALLAQGAIFTADETAKLDEGNRLQGASH